MENNVHIFLFDFGLKCDFDMFLRFTVYLPDGPPGCPSVIKMQAAPLARLDCGFSLPLSFINLLFIEIERDAFKMVNVVLTGSISLE